MDGKLYEYNKKRDFSRTAEPNGKPGARQDGKGRKFVVQRHLARAEHFDLRLELDGVLLSWAIPKGPSFNTADKRLAVMVEPHPVEYADFEGVIPKGEYGGGTVMLWDEGVWEPRVRPQTALKKGELKFTLFGKRLRGDWALIRMADTAEADEKNWLLIKEKDEYAKKEAGTENFKTSIRSGLTIKQIGASQASKKNPFDRASVQLAEAAESVPHGDEWLYELKYDGYRALAFTEKGKTRLISRNGADFTDKFTPVAKAVEAHFKGRAAVLDGEIVVTDKNGIPDFQAIQAYEKNPSSGGAPTYVIFDVLALDGKDLRNMPLTIRKEKLSSVLKNAPPPLALSGYVRKMDKKSFDRITDKGLEGIVAKKAQSQYAGKRNGDWIKIKQRRKQELVIAGYTPDDTGGIKSLILGYYDDGVLKYAGRAGTGLNAAVKRELKEKFASLKQVKRPFENADKAPENAVWLKPKLTAETEFAEWTKDGVLRQASFKGLRYDKAAKEAAREKYYRRDTPQETVAGVKISHPDKIMFPDCGFTKLNVAQYYERVAPRIMPHIKDRLLSAVCCPDGINGQRFFKRHLSEQLDGVRNAPAGDGEDYFYIYSAVGIVSLAQYNAVELHAWGCKKNSPDRPDVMVFDLDPDERLDAESVIRGALELKKLLEKLGLKSFIKTSGGKGYHIATPFRPTADWDTVRAFSKKTAELMAAKYPDKFTSVSRLSEREGRIYIDWQRNGLGSTSAAPYSLRLKPIPTVSMPVSWRELKNVTPDGFKPDDAIRRLNKADPWADFAKTKLNQKIKPCFD